MVSPQRVACYSSAGQEIVMSDVAARHSELMTVEDFLAFLDQRSSEERWELIDGVPMMMVGGTLAHARIAGNVDRLLAPAAEKRGCMSLRGFLVEASETSSFEPDVMVRCGDMEDMSRRAADRRSSSRCSRRRRCGSIAS